MNQRNNWFNLTTIIVVILITFLVHDSQRREYKRGYEAGLLHGVSLAATERSLRHSVSTGSITSSKIETGTITASTIEAGTITAYDLNVEK